jgi:hypothetical protein
VIAPFRHQGLVTIRMWLERPPASIPRGSTRVRRVYAEDQLYVGLVRMVDPR